MAHMRSVDIRILLSTAVDPHPAAFFEEIAISCRFQNRSLQPQAESGSCVVLSGHLAAMVGPPGRPGGVVVGYPPRTPAQARVCTAPGDVPAPCPRSPRGYWSMVRVAIGSAIHHFSLFHSRPVYTKNRAEDQCDHGPRL